MTAVDPWIKAEIEKSSLLTNAMAAESISANAGTAAILRFELHSPEATNFLAQRLAPLCQIGDAILLWGDFGTGKTTFARAFIQARCRDATEVPSPSFTLVQVYEPIDGLTGSVYHFDLYRINAPEELVELAIDDAWTEGIALVEWPDKLGPLLPDLRLDIRLEHGPTPGNRRVVIEGHPSWRKRLEGVLVG